MSNLPIPEGNPPSHLLFPTEKVRQLFDLVVHSMDFGSGFLYEEDVKLLREIAVAIGVNPMNATPSEFKRNYPHPFVEVKSGWRKGTCETCSSTIDNELAHPEENK